MSQSPAAGAGAPSSLASRIGRVPLFRAGASPLAMLLVALAAAGLIIAAVTTPEFLSVGNVKTILRSGALIGVIAIGLTFVTISGNFFLLSLEQTAALTSVVFALALKADWGLAGSLAIALLAAASTGAVQGTIVGLGANPIIVTLGAAGVLFGVASTLSDNRVILMPSPNPAHWLGSAQPLGIPVATWAFILAAVLGTIVLRKTRFGRQVYLVGASPAAATASGLSRFGIALAVFSLAGAATGVAAILFSAQLSQGAVDLFVASFGASGSLTISSIAAVMVGGTSIWGGHGSIARTAVGAIFIAAVDNLLLLRGFSTGVRIAFIGLAVVAAVGIYALLQKGKR